MRVKDILTMKIMTFFSNNNTIIQTENLKIEDTSTEEEAIEYIKEKWNNLNFKTSLEKIESILIKTKIKKWKWNLLKATLYYDVDKKESEKILQYLEKNSLEEIIKEKEYWELKYKIELTEECLDKLVYDFSQNREELLLNKFLLESKHKDAIDLLESLNKTDELNYLILKFNEEFTKIKTEEDIFTRTKEILEKLESKSLITQLKILSDIINFLQINIPLVSNAALDISISMYLKKYNKNFKLNECISNQWEKDMINTYISISLKIEFLEIKRIKLLEEYKQYLDDYNNIIYLILKNKGYKKCIMEFILKQEYLEIEKIYNRLFLMKKYKYLIQNFRKYLKNKNEVPIEIKRVEIYSKFMSKKNISIDELKILESDKEAKLSELYVTIYKYKNNEITIEDFRKKANEMLENKFNIGYFHLCVIRIIYIYDKQWLIDILNKNKNEQLYLIEELIELATLDYDLDGITYEKICSLEPGVKNLNYESIGKGYMEYKNFKKGLYFFFRAWEKNKSLRLASEILHVLLILEKYNQEIYEYLERKIPPEDKILKLKNIIMYSFDNMKRAEIEMNKILLNISEDILVQNEIFFKTLYLTFVLKKKYENNEYENSIYIDKKIEKIPEIYEIEKREDFEYFSKEDFDIFKLAFEERLENLNTYLINKMLGNKKLKGKKCPGIISIDFEKNQKNILEIIRKITGKDKYEKNKKEYLEGKINKSILTFCGYFEDYYLLMNEYIEKFNENLLNKLDGRILENTMKILSLDSIIFLCELDLFKYLNLKQTCILKTVYDEIKSKAETDEKYKTILIELHKKVQIIDDSSLNDMKRDPTIRNSEVSIILKIYHAWEKTKGDFITEDKDCLFKGKIGTYSSIYLILLEVLKGKLDENLLSEKAKEILKITKLEILSRVKSVN